MKYINKYKLWDIRKGKMLSWEEVENQKCSILSNSKYVPLQYSRTNNYIDQDCEGDILKGVFKTSEKEFSHTHNQIFYTLFKWDRWFSGFSIDFPDKSCHVPYGEECCLYEVKKVGNIFENPEFAPFILPDSKYHRSKYTNALLQICSCEQFNKIIKSPWYKENQLYYEQPLSFRTQDQAQAFLHLNNLNDKVELCTNYTGWTYKWKKPVS